MTTTSGTPAASPPGDLHQIARDRLRKRRELGTHALAYLLFNSFLVVVWLLTTPEGFFWPVFPIFGWGIGLAFHAWDVLIGSEPSEDAIRAEMDRLGKR
ncbi:2TM domain-containing protein [Actinoplanes oblitus]|uniref:2TM domain-containing protein n=1 Tax=Actinoplanes oblitus TaxID=3040509 RepID=A0ABY8W4X9_9ACTN|nr:2TM domain-containing protein [Actinoplanes oblitus]WIM92916.1 2TM domain-containing protein [Actinoplanes oblitus]